MPRSVVRKRPVHEDDAISSDSDCDGKAMSLELSDTNSNKIVYTTQVSHDFALSVSIAACKQGAVVRKKGKSIRVNGAIFTLKLTGDVDALADGMQTAACNTVSSEAALFAHMMMYNKQNAC